MTDAAWYAVAAGALGLAWAFVTLLGRMCRHQWEKDGPAYEKTEWATWDNGARVHNSDYKVTYQPLRCTKCGKLREHELR